MADTEEQTITPDVETTATPPTSEPAEAPPPPAAQKRSGIIAPLLGGILAAGAGFGLAQYVPNGWPSADTSALQATLDVQSKEIAALKDQIAQLPVPEAAPAVDLAPINATVADLATRLDALESQPAQPADTTALSDAVAKLQADLAALKASGPVPANVAALTAEAEARLQEAEAQAAQIAAEAEALASKAARTAALGRLQTAIDGGAPYAELLPGLGLSVPAALQDHAGTGLPSLTALQDGFPHAARLALESALRADMGDSWTERATSFFRSQTGARSLTPQDGNDPDAVLSRAEAALASGDLDTTLSELANLPQVAQDALADWRGLAERRQAGLKSLAYVASKIEE